MVKFIEMNDLFNGSYWIFIEDRMLNYFHVIPS